MPRPWPPRPRSSSQPGQSLWGIAQSVAPNDDVRATIERLVSLNNLESTSVLPGQKLVVPAAG